MQPVPYSLARRAALALIAAAGLGCGAAAAQDWRGLAIGDTGGGAARAFADAYYAAEALRGWSGAAPVLLRNAAHADAVEALDGLQGAGRLVLYYAGPVQPDGGLISDGHGLALAARLEPLAAAGLSHLLLLVENCAGTAREAAALPDLSVEAAKAGVTLTLAASAGAGEACPGAAAGGRLSDAMKTAAKAQGAAAAGALQAFVRNGSGEVLAGLGGAKAVAAPARRAQVPVADTVRLIPARAQAPNRPVAAVRPVSVPANGLRGGGAALALPAPQLAALPRAEGLPQPSVIVGVIGGAGGADFAAAQDPADLQGSEIAYDNLAARQRLRSGDPDLFASLVAAGAFDPPAPLLPQALQSELARMGCYTSRIDGDWGRGSQAAARRYFEAAGGGSPASLEATAELFRLIISRDDAACARPVAAAPRANAISGGSRQTQARRAAPAQAPSRQPAQTITPGSALGGVFR
ncbi:hypothetical protein K3725_21285 (plasmid) [Leisingera sp. S132]|uniref:hypothetical protein n=1 Tax=Leisingera sp. S132 TaxID=2867016 RepID=UPI0021A4F3A9|nr:hypothetical protein [Leisingera sp. S132]UWQ81763.1 hypothetical protein K3725_21285 [Leisingera sp. S132]